MQTNVSVPDFSLSDTGGNIHRLSDYRGKVAIVNFWSAECPWSERADQRLKAVADQANGQVVILPVASNSNEPVEFITQVLHQRGLDFVLVDQGSQLSEQWGAKTTPHAFVVDQSGILRYQGAVDDVTFRKRTPEIFYIEQAVAALLAGKLPETQEAPPYGCTIVRSF